MYLYLVLRARFAYLWWNILAGAKFDYVQVLNCREMALFAGCGRGIGAPGHRGISLWSF